MLTYIVLCILCLNISTETLTSSEPCRQESLMLEEVLKQFKEELSVFKSEITNKVDDYKSEMKDLVYNFKLDVQQDFKSLQVEMDVHTSSLQKKYNMYSAFGCVFDSISLSCSDEAQILVTEAELGAYFHYCAEDTCCSPHPGDDCTVHMETNSPSDWAALKTQCDGLNSCQYEYDGSVFDGVCASGTVADYLRIRYSCLPDSATNMVAFTVHSVTARDYEEGELLIYDQAITNLGGHFQLSENVFTCPYSGLYLFSLTLTAVKDSGKSMRASLFLDGDYVLEACANAQTDELSTGSNTALLYCSNGQRVWCQSRTNNEKMSGGTWSSFSGVLIHYDDSSVMF